MLKRYLGVLVPGLLMAGCGVTFDPGQVTGSSAGGLGEHTDDVPDAPDAPAPEALDVDIYIETITCVETIARFEASLTGPNYACKWTFDDGTTSNECVGEHQFAVDGFHDFVLEVTDLDTGATGRATQTRFFHPPLALTLDVTGDDLSINYRATSNTGGEQVVFVSPSELVVVDDPDYPRTTTGTVRVLEAGTYTVTYDVEDERGVSEICSGQITKTITLVCDGEGHVHP